MKGNILFITGCTETEQVYRGLSKIKNQGYRIFLLSDIYFDPLPEIFEKQFIFDISKTLETLKFIKKQPLHFKAVITKSCEVVPPLIALLAKHYGCIGEDPEVAFACRSKYHMRKQMNAGGLPIPKFKLCKNYREIVNAVKQIKIPCVLKPIGGHSSYGTFMIRDKNDLKTLEKNYRKSIRYLTELSKKDIKQMASLNKEELKLIGIQEPVNMITDYLVEEYMEGPEISVDCLTQNGKTTIMGIAEQLRMAPPYFVQIAEKIPFLCDKNLKQQIVRLVKKTIKTIGIKNSPSHTEIILTPNGPKIVEIACRIGADNIHDAIYHTTGYNLMYESIMIALGFKRNYKIKTKTHTAMQYLLPLKKGKIIAIQIPDALKKDPDVIEIYTEKNGIQVAPPPENFDFIGYVNVKGKTREKAQKKLENALSQIRVTIQ